MSIRTSSTDTSYATAVRRDLQNLKATALENARLDAVDHTVRPEGAEAAAAYDALTPVEQSAASLGVHPAELKPIGFMNAGESHAIYLCPLQRSHPLLAPRYSPLREFESVQRPVRRSGAPH